MNFRSWAISRLTPVDIALPDSLLTRTVFDAGGALEAATALLLPSSDVATPLDQIRALDRAAQMDDRCLGLWLAAPHPLGQDVLAQLKSSQLGWVSNFPSCAMFGTTFARQLSEVGTGPPQEWAALAAAKEQGKRILLTVTPGETSLPDLKVDALLLVVQSAEDLKALSDGTIARLHDAFAAETPIVLHGGTNGHLPRDPTALRVSALLDLPS